MKTINFIIVPCVIILLCLCSCDNSDSSPIGTWEVRPHIDEFGDESDEYFLQNIGIGYFSNSVTNSSPLTVAFCIDKSRMAFLFYEYNKYTANKSTTAELKIKDSEGNVYEMNIFNYNQNGIYEVYSSDIKKILEKGGVISGHVDMYDYTKCSYTFKMDMSKYEEANKIFLEKMRQTTSIVKYIDENEIFLKENQRQEGVITTNSGLQYKIIKQGNGRTPKETDRVTVNYRSTLIDGTEIDSSYKRNGPITFGLNQTIQGWVEGFQLMQEGAIFVLYVPQELAYKEQERGNVKPFSTIIFEIEFIKIEE